MNLKNEYPLINAFDSVWSDDFYAGYIFRIKPLHLEVRNFPFKFQK